MDDEEYKFMIRQSFDEASSGYDTTAMRFFDDSAEHLVGCLPISGGEHILDVATGTGKTALAAARRLKSGHVTAIDLSDGMLEQAKKKAMGENLTNILQNYSRCFTKSCCISFQPFLYLQNHVSGN